ncbi:glycine cleavage system protein R [Persicirhabdus sediminis]|uniref:ACT domain-containing protein n=1 Tax=Persicirhabdus sediminis TaxID=454144 RepID=A0A8J7MDD1_9BACT|nr:ACT domain-containing protein [Persicirhabdus sediminis]MBK1790537.1 hypothetical protein [Persicirhabdus sediminis]
MSASLILTIHAKDRPGIVRTVSQTVEAGGGNWLESRMARLAGQFVGIARIHCAIDDVKPMASSLNALQAQGIFIDTLGAETDAIKTYDRCLAVEIFGNDRKGIVNEVTTAVTKVGGNVEELHTSIESAAMAGNDMFKLQGTICLKDEACEEELIAAIESISDDLTIEFKIGGN